MSAAVADDASLLERVSRFLVHEAELLDARRHAEWLALWSDDGEVRYWVPCNDEGGDPSTSLALILDDRRHLEERVMRLGHRLSHNVRPAPRLTRVVGNIVAEQSADGVRARATFVLGECRRDEQRTWFGRSEYRLRSTPAGLRIVDKKVVLLNNDTPLPNLVFLP